MAVFKKYINGAWVTQSTMFPVKVGGRVEPDPGSIELNIPTVDSNGLVTASATLTPGMITDAPENKTFQLSIQAEKTIIPSTTQQTAVSTGKYTTGDIVVAAVPTGEVTMNTPTVNSSGLVTVTASVTAGLVSAATPSKTLQLTTQAAKTVTPSDSQQTAVVSGRYTTGNVVVAAVPSDTYIKRSEIVTFYTGTSAPSSSLGSNGDLYLQT